MTSSPSYRIEKVFNELVTFGPLQEIMSYSLFPAGKLFRPKLCLAVAQDLNCSTEGRNLDYLMAAIEFHHVYSLIHDDLPCMDNDEMRRQRPSSHVKYNQWKALLAGDALLNLSFESLALIDHPATKELIKTFAQEMGANGLIAGQYIDLEEGMPDWEQTLRMHRLKTANLIAYSLKSAYTICKEATQEELSEVKELGIRMGINFQLYDDLSELDQNNNEHEYEVNAFLRFPAQQVYAAIIENNRFIMKTLTTLKLLQLKAIYLSYLEGISSKINIKNKDELLILALRPND